MEHGPDQVPTDDATEAGRRRDFLQRYGRLAALAPPAIVAILNLEATPAEVAGSGFGGGPPGGLPPGPPSVTPPGGGPPGRR